MKYNRKQLRIGQKIEMEHTRNPKIALKIAKDHLREFKNAKYYTALVKMERQLKKQTKRKRR
jgi:hypothetical protein